jgi:hypothetical protein
MAHFRILASYTVYCSINVEADNIDEARELARDADGGDFNSDYNGGWNIDDVITLQNESEATA